MTDNTVEIDKAPEDKIAKFRCRYGEVLGAIEILRGAVANEFDTVEISQVGGLLEIVYERMQQDIVLLDTFIDEYGLSLGTKNVNLVAFLSIFPYNFSRNRERGV